MAQTGLIKLMSATRVSPLQTGRHLPFVICGCLPTTPFSLGNYHPRSKISSSNFTLCHTAGGWGFEHLTEDIIHYSAQWQENYFLRSTLMPTHSHNEATVVAASLRCLVISHETNQTSANWSNLYFLRKDERYVGRPSRSGTKSYRPKHGHLAISSCMEIRRGRRIV